MKKRMTLVALLLMLALLVTGCGKNSGNKPGNSEPNTKIEGTGENKPGTETEDLNGAEISVQAEKEWMSYYQAAADRVMKANPGTKIELKEVSAFDHLKTLDSTDALNADVADVFAIPADRLYGLNDAKVLLPFDAPALAAKIGGFKDYEAGLGGSFKINGEYFAFPFNIETLITYVNKANAKAAGLDPNGTFEIAGQKDAATVLLPIFDAWYGVALTNAAHIELLGKDEKGAFFSDMTKDYAELSAEQKSAIETIYNYWKAHNDAGTSLFDSDAGNAYVEDQFKTGNKGVVRLAGPWDQGKIAEMVGEENMMIASIDKITLNGKALSHWKGGWGLAINARNEKDQKKVKLAEKMIAEIVNPKYAVDLFVATGKVLENVPAETYQASNLSDAQKQIVAATIASFEKAPARPLFTEWGDVWDTWKNAILSWNNVKPANPEAAYKEIQASFNSMMQKIQK